MHKLILHYTYIISLTKTQQNGITKKDDLFLAQHKHWSFSLRIFFGKFDQIHSKLQIWWQLLKQSLMGDLILNGALSYQLQQNLGAFSKLLCEMSVNDYFIGLSIERGKQDSENVTNLQKDRISFWQIHYRLVEKLN